MKKIIKIASASVVIIFIILVALYKLMNMTTFQLFGEITNHINTEKKVVALTFDDGPNENTDEILTILAAEDVKATFYLIGDEIENNKEQAKKINEAGHQIGNHSYAHSRMIFKSSNFISSEIEKTNDLIRKSGYEGEITFRPPYGKKLFALPLYLHQQNIRTVMWDLDPLQTLPPTASSQEITNFVVENTKPGSIILIHPWYGEENNSREAMPKIIDSLKNEGYAFVTVSDLLAK